MREDIVGMTCDALREAARIRVLDGRYGLNRCRTRYNALAAEGDDVDAVLAWINDRGASSDKTRRIYLSEARRLYYWLFEHARKPLSSLTLADLCKYLEFLKTPPHDSIGGKVRYVDLETGLINPHWKPFEKPMTDVHAAQVFRVLRSLFKYLTLKNYLDANPLISMPIATKRSASEDEADRVSSHSRLLDQEQWQAVLNAVDSLVGTAEQERMRFVLRLFYYLGARIEEVPHQQMGNFLELRGQWGWTFIGTTGKRQWLPIDDHLLEAVQRYRQHLNRINSQLNLSALPSPEECHPVVFDLYGKKPVSSRQLFKIIKAAFRIGYEQYKYVDPDKAGSLMRASPAWIRRTRARHLAQQAESLEEFLEIQTHMRERTLDSTVRFARADDRVGSRKRIGGS